MWLAGPWMLITFLVSYSHIAQKQSRVVSMLLFVCLRCRYIAFAAQLSQRCHLSSCGESRAQKLFLKFNISKSGLMYFAFLQRLSDDVSDFSIYSKGCLLSLSFVTSLSLSCLDNYLYAVKICVARALAVTKEGSSPLCMRRNSNTCFFLHQLITILHLYISNILAAPVIQNF